MLGVKFTVLLHVRAVLKERSLPVGARARRYGMQAACLAMAHATVPRLTPQQAGAPFCFDDVTSYA